MILTAEIRQKFGVIGNCNDLQEVLAIVVVRRFNLVEWRNVAAFGMVLCATQAVRETSFYHDTCHVVDQLALGKVALDRAGGHSMVVASTTGAILMNAQIYVYKEAMPCTEWPLPAEVAAFVLDKACQLVDM
ncbi:hypothetical protein [Hymenobacter negativus]|uniref:Uncharacterized protein n=1 Tax=Hymenobacter negativus TaxID=2795026 RepID=A0ABS3QF21_9BACT|nr:hypothetical protein [Hymenobacter negativus]MBO2009696.1 hypothetical protein [Hymenobacter negativus]